MICTTSESVNVLFVCIYLYLSNSDTSHPKRGLGSVGSHLRPDCACCSKMMIGAEPLSGYKCGGYHPVHLGDKLYGDRFTILHKLGWGSYATIWLARDSAVLEPCVDVPDLNNTE
jgi:hypothetical protein